MSTECIHHPLSQDVDCEDNHNDSAKENTISTQQVHVEHRLQTEEEEEDSASLFGDEEIALLHQSSCTPGEGGETAASAAIVHTESFETTTTSTPPGTPTNPLLPEASSNQQPQQPQMPLSPPPLHPSSPWNHPSISSYDPTFSYNRRRRAPSVTSSSASSTTVVSLPNTTTNTTTLTPARPRRQQYNNLAHVFEERGEHHQQQRGLRASLDAGLQAMRKLVRSSSPSTTRRSNTRRTTPPVQSSSLQEQTQTLHASTRVNENDAHLLQYHNIQPDTAGAPDDTTIPTSSFPQTPIRESIRQRAQSEPDAARLRDFHLETTATTATTPQQQQQQLLPPSSSSVRRRRLRMRAFTEEPRGHLSAGSPQLLSSPAAAALSSSSSSLSAIPSSPGQTTTTAAALPVWSAARSSSNSSGGNRSRSNSLLFGNNNNANTTPRVSSGSTTTSNNNNGNIGGHDDNNSNSRGEATQNSSSDDRNNNNNTNTNNTETTTPSQQQQQATDRERHARMRWVRINRRFQLVITIVALLFSLLLFAILICWVVLTSAYIVSFEKSCAVPLKPYFWLVTFQLVLDVFRNDIMRLVFHWDANLQQRIPCRVVAYNVAYLIYAMMVLRLGILSVFVDPERAICEKTAPELYRSSAAFVSLSIAAWATIIGGYLLPFCVVAIMLTCNGYNPSALSSSSSLSPDRNTAQPVFPAAYSSTGAPAGCIELIPVVSYDNYVAAASECCICMEEFRPQDVVVETGCKHIFHKSCCQAWLLQARSCPVCRTDIPSNLEQTDLSSAPPSNNEQHDQRRGRSSNNNNSSGGGNTSPRHQIIPMGPTGRPVRGLLQMLQHSDSGSLDRQYHPRVTRSSRSSSASPVSQRPWTRTSSAAAPAGVASTTAGVELSTVVTSSPATTAPSASVDLEDGRGRMYGRSN